MFDCLVDSVETADRRHTLMTYTPKAKKQGDEW